MTELYMGYGLNKTYLGYCENGDIYKGQGLNKTFIGTYENGEIYKGCGLNKTYIGYYSNGEVYKGYGINKDFIGSYKSGDIIKGYGLNKTYIGSYKGIEGGAAAATLLLLLELTVEDEKSKSESINYTHKIDNPNNTSPSNPKGNIPSGSLLTFCILFFIGAIPPFCERFAEYLYLLFYMIIPGLVLIISTFIKYFSKRKKSFSRFIIGCLKGFVSMIIIIPIIHTIIHTYNDVQIVNSDFAINTCAILITLIGGVLNSSCKVN